MALTFRESGNPAVGDEILKRLRADGADAAVGVGGDSIKPDELLQRLPGADTPSSAVLDEWLQFQGNARPRPRRPEAIRSCSPGGRTPRRRTIATLQQGVGFNSAITGAIILIVLWLALRSVRIVLAVVITLLAGLVVTTALGLLLVGAFNPISVAFAVLFVGLGADFAIQFSVRYRAQRHELGDLKPALVSGELARSAHL